MINPEDGSDFPYHATDVRNAILRNEYEKLDDMIPAEIKPMVVDQISREILAASRGEGQEFIPGRQTVDVIYLLRDGGKTYVLIGKRNMNKVDFPGVWAIPGGGIEEFESPINAAVRCFFAETGISITVCDNSNEPAGILLSNISGKPAKLHFIGIYASEDERINGTRGGGSQCFAILTEGSVDEQVKVLNSTHDLEMLKFADVDEIHSMSLAFDQKRMLFDALNRFGITYDNGEYLEVFAEDGVPIGKKVSRLKAHEVGVLHGASHTYIFKNEEGVLWCLLQRRAMCKDSYPGCLDTSSAGHVEAGSDFIETAKKELFEELGLVSENKDFRELFEQRVDITSKFRSKTFRDKEINKVYALDFVPDDNDIRLQPEELSEVVWVPVDVIMENLKKGDPEYCLNKDEFEKVIEKISKS